MTYACNHQCLYCSCPWEAPIRPGQPAKAVASAALSSTDGDVPEIAWMARLFSGLTQPANQSHSRPADERSPSLLPSPHLPYPIRPELTIGQWKNVIDDLTTKHGVCRLCFTGGEPTLKPGLRDIMEYAAGRTAEFVVSDPETGLRRENKPPELYVISNGRTLDESWFELFTRLRVTISLSLPGLTTYARHTGQGKPEEVLYWMKRFSQAGLRVIANVTVTQLNFFELYETIGNALLHGASFLLMNRFLPGGRGLAHQHELLLSGDQVRQAILTADEVLSTANRFGSLGTEVPFCLVADLKPKKLTLGTRCAGGREFFAIDPSGAVRPCNHSPVFLGDWSRIDDILQGDYWRRFLFKDYLPGSCSTCDLAFQCDGGCREAAHIVGGSLDSPDPILPNGVDWRRRSAG
jgi:radical SAM protein with 4Fe4S-binding SPASM domain